MTQEQQIKNQKRNQEYIKYVETVSHRQDMGRAILKAFIIGGLICCLGQAISDIAMAISPKVDKQLAGVISSSVLVALTVILTGIGVFDKLGAYAGGGTFLPISGFANSIASAAMEFKAEGLVFGLSSKFFFIAGPVVVNAIVGSAIVGIIYWLIQVIGG